MKPEAAMKLAIAQARRARGRTFPNPAVGAVVFKGDRVLGRGCTRPVGGPHAEIIALRNAKKRFGAAALRGATIAITLEPCSHQGRTGPCADAVVDAGIRKVIVGCIDPNPQVRGKGMRRLRRAGIEVETGILEEKCRAEIRGFQSLHEQGRPYVVLKLAGSLDGRIATAAGESRWITGERSRREVHRLRSRMDAIVVGSGTVLADDPELTARREDRIVHRPIRVVIDSGLRVAPQARLFRDGEAWVLCTRDAAARRKASFEAVGAQLISVRKKGAHLDLKAALHTLGQRGLTEILVEGGGLLAAALLKADLVDEVHWFVAPKLLGSDGRPALGELGLSRLADAVTFDTSTTKRLGEDFYFCGPIQRRRAKS